MRIFAIVQKCHTGWLTCTVIGNGAIGDLADWLLPFIEDDAREHVGIVIEP